MDAVFYGVGTIVVLLLVAYFVLYAVYDFVRKNADASIRLDAMPMMRPIPIPTKNRKSSFMKLLVMLYEVRRWQVQKNWTFHYKPTNGLPVEIIIPEGFRFDGASIARPFWALLSPVGLLLIPGLVHDYAYRYDQLWIINQDGEVVPWNKGAGKKFWDNVFKEVGSQVNDFKIIDVIAWLALGFGGGSWKSNRRRNEEITKPVIYPVSKMHKSKQDMDDESLCAPFGQSVL